MMWLMYRPKEHHVTSANQLMDASNTARKRNTAVTPDHEIRFTERELALLTDVLQARAAVQTKRVIQTLTTRPATEECTA